METLEEKLAKANAELSHNLCQGLLAELEKLAFLQEGLRKLLKKIREEN